MPHLPRLLAFAVIQSLAGTMVQRGVFYLTAGAPYRFSERENLLMALCAGAVYVVGALSSHALTRRTGERLPLVLTMLGQLAALAAMTLFPTPGMLVGGLLALMFFTGVMWPIIESYVSAGLTPAQSARVIGFYNIAWSAPMPLAVWLTGPIIARAGPMLFACSAVGSLAALILALPLPRSPQHMPADHPERPDATRLARMRALMHASRASMVASYAMLFILAPLLPKVFDKLEYSVVAATFMAGFLEAGRFVAFAIMQRTTAWHDRRDVLAYGAILLPAGFLLALLIPHGAAIFVGTLFFGVAQGVVYYGALYYAMVVSNASVDAGGAHEGLIGSGFVLGPLAALAGTYFGQHLPASAVSVQLGMFLGVSPIVIAGVAASLWPLWKAPGGSAKGDPRSLAVETAPETSDH